MGDRYDISVDIGEGKDKTFATFLRIGEDGKYIPVISTDSLTLAESIQRKNYGVESKKYTFSAEIVDVDCCALRGFFGLDFVRDMMNALLSYRVDTCGKRRKTTYKTIRRDCAKRNRHK